MAKTKNMKNLQAVVKLNIKPPDSKGKYAKGCVVCSGLVKVLRSIEDDCAINSVTRTDHIAYSKAWSLLNSTEKELGYKLVRRDGARGSTLTPEGKKLLEVYDKLIAKLNEVAAAELAKLLA
jgi:molybdate transport system regulatory protein